MKTEDLKEYLSIAVDMEKNIYLQKQLQYNLEQEIERLKVPVAVREPVEPDKLSYPTEPESMGCFMWIVLCVGSFGGAFLASLFASGIFLCNLFGMPDEIQLPLSILIAVVFSFYNIGKNVLTMQKEREDFEARKQELNEQYQAQLKHHQAELKNIKYKLEQNKAVREAKTLFIQKEKEQVEMGLADSKKHIQLLYEQNVIFPKYRNLVMVCSLYEYICAGRCVSLEGHEGGYNILEAEIRMDHVITQLDQVIAGLEQIKRNQFMLYSAIQDSNQRLTQIRENCSRMEASLDDLYDRAAQLNANSDQLNTTIAEWQKSSALTAYHAERAQKELAYMNRMDYLCGRNDGVFWNQPPV